jgi:hypothetical protein
LEVGVYVRQEPMRAVERRECRRKHGGGQRLAKETW